MLKFLKVFHIERGGESIEKDMGDSFSFCLTFMLVGCGKEEKPQEAFDTYTKAWNKQKFTEMYDQLSEKAKKAISKKEFTEKYEKIYYGIEVKNLKVEAGEVKE